VSVTVVGSIAFDAVKTPFGSREWMLGGAATHFALAASFFDTVHVVGPVGEDFGDQDLAVLATRGTDVSDVERVAGGRTFFWKGEYGWDLNSRETRATELGVFERFEPNLSAGSRSCEVLFLANIQPQLQLSVLEQCEDPRFVAVDSMNLWIDIARDDLIEVIRRVDCVMLNDAELRQLTRRPNLLGAARDVLELGPSMVVAKQGEYGASLITGERFFALPAYPLELVVDPTGAGDTFAGGFVGHLARNLGDLPAPAESPAESPAEAPAEPLGEAPADEASDHVLRQAMAYGTALASFNVEEFGTERVVRLTADEIRARVDDLRRMTQFEHDPIALG
jgi:sugar/nucleoside kinase (ribokinase family)